MTASRATVPTSGPDDPEQSTGLSQDVAFEILSCRRRRYVLHYLMQREQPAHLRELSTQIAAWENDTSPEAVTYKERMRVYTALRQLHLPKMADNGVIEFDADRGTVELTSDASSLEVYLDVVPHDSIPWSTYYAGLGLFSAGLVVAAWANLVPFGLLPGIAWAAVVTALFTVSALVHVYRDRKMQLGGDGLPPTERGWSE